MSEFIRKEIKELAEIILEQSQKLIDYPQGAPQIEVDIIKENIRKLYEHMDSLVNTNWQSDTAPQEKTIEESTDSQVEELLDIAAAQIEDNQEQITQQIQEQDEVIEEQNEVVEEEIELSPEIVEDTKETTSDEIHFDETPTAKEEKPEPELENTAATKIVSENETTNLGDHLQQKPISSLKSAIGINDKFQFINELFDGSMKVYNQAIDQLEQAKDKTEAFDMFNKIAGERKWDEEDTVYTQLFDYVNRRF